MATALTLEAEGLRFSCLADGKPDRPLVLLLHGYPQTFHTWRAQLPALAAAGFYALAPNQRGYSPGARPEGVASYATDELVGDAIALAECCGRERFHLVGHDWGGQLAWLLAAHHPERVASLTVLSRPHPAAFARAFALDPEQAHRSRHHRAFQDPGTGFLLLEDGARRLRRSLSEQGVGDPDIDAYLSELRERPALEAALNWYRAAAAGQEGGASGLLGPAVPDVTAPTLYLWGESDASVGRIAAELTSEHVSGPYRLCAIPGAGHFLTDDAGETVTAELLAHLARQPQA